jgi:transaldolase
MKLFLDTANLDEISDAINKGIVEGVTTNPSILAKEPKTDFLGHIKKIASLCGEAGNLPLSVEVFAKDANSMFGQAMEIINDVGYENLNIKIPVGFEELEVINKLSSEGVDVNCTCCFTAAQMEMATLAGSKYVSLFYNRLIDVGGDPLQVAATVSKFIDEKGTNTEIIAGSIRNPYDIVNAWEAGCHIVTAGYSVIKKSMKHSKTDESVNGFLKDFESWIS